jgi:phage terminase Nu1 subunit (DNA packaging protein)
MKQSISELSHLTGMDRRRIRGLLCDLPSETGPKGALLYESAEALPLLYLQPGDGDTFDLTDERARLAHHQANRAALEAEQLAGSLIEIEAVASVVGEEYSNVRSRLLAISTRAAPQVIGLSIVEVKALLDDMVFEALDELSADDPSAQA